MDRWIDKLWNRDVDDEKEKDLESAIANSRGGITITIAYTR